MYMQMQDSVMMHDPNVKIIISKSKSLKKFGFIQIDMNMEIEEIIEYIQQNLNLMPDERKKFFESDNLLANQLSQTIK